MDGKRFDDLTRRLAGGHTRRTVLRAGAAGALAGAIGLAGAEEADARHACRTIGAVCSKPGDCCSGTCGPRDAHRRRHCICDGPEDCPVPASACEIAVCSESGACSTVGTCDDTESCVDGECCHASYAGFACDTSQCCPGWQLVNEGSYCYCYPII